MSQIIYLFFVSSVFLLLTVDSELSAAKSDVESFLVNPHYLNYENLTERLRDFEAKYPHLCRLDTLGVSVEKRQIWALEISENVEKRALGKPMVKYIGNMHGDEAVGRQLLVYLAEYLLEGYGSDTRVTNLLNNLDIFLVPSMNPDGFEAAREGECESLEGFVGRNNANGIDLNRDFPDQFDHTNEKRERQPETLSLMKWILDNPFVLSGNFHGGAVVASYPFDNSPAGVTKRRSGHNSMTPDDELFKKMAVTYSRGNAFMSSGQGCSEDRFPGGITNGAHWYELAVPDVIEGVAHVTPDNEWFMKAARTFAQHNPDIENGSCDDESFENGITNGAFWYLKRGGMQDFNYVNTNCFEVTFEVSCCKFPNATELPQFWRLNKESMLAYLELAFVGVKGYVRDSKGDPVAGARVHVSGITHDIVTSDRGEFWRLLLPGDYKLSINATSYKPSEENEIVVQSLKEMTMVNFTLQEAPSNHAGLVKISASVAVLPLLLQLFV